MERKSTMREIRSACQAGKKDWLKSRRPVGSGVFVCAVLAKGQGGNRMVAIDEAIRIRFDSSEDKNGDGIYANGEQAYPFRRKDLVVLFKPDGDDPFEFAREVAERVKKIRAEEDDLSELDPTIITPVCAGPLAVTVEGASEMCSLGRATLYRAISEGSLVARKHGDRTLILVEELNAFLKNLPTSK